MRQLSETDLVALRGWSDFLETQIAVLKDEIVRKNGYPLRAHESDAVFIQIDDLTQRTEIEEAVRQFLGTGTWPKLSYAELRLLSLRAFRARSMVLALASKVVNLADVTSAAPADFHEKAGVIHWLLIDAWETATTESRRDSITEFLRLIAGGSSKETEAEAPVSTKNR